MRVFVSYPELLFNQILACATMCCGWLGATHALHLKRIKGLSCASPAQINMTRLLLQYCQFSQSWWELHLLGMQPRCLIDLLSMDMCHWVLTGLGEIFFVCPNYFQLFLVMMLRYLFKSNAVFQKEAGFIQLWQLFIHGGFIHGKFHKLKFLFQ